ncbi:MAG: DUF1287 domain-containing protein [Methylococcales bacterium]
MRGLVFVWLFLVSGLVTAQTSEASKVVAAARSQIGVTTTYDPAYSRLSYPMGDVPLERGVCSDVVIRAYRKAGIDFQQLVHKDMQANFSLYPKIWKLKKTDSNIDHRRVPNLEVFFKRKDKALNLPQVSDSYKPGDIVSWRLDNGLAHIGIVSDKKSLFDSRPLVIHNIGQGTQEEDVLFSWRIVGHYRWFRADGASR